MFESIKRLDGRYKAAFISTVVFGFLAHAVAFFNKFSINDDLILFLPGATFSSGRWMLGIIAKIEQSVFGDYTVSLPFFNGVLSVIFIALASMIIVYALDIKRHSLCALIGCIFVTFPTVTAIFGYMFTAHYYMFSMFIGVAGAALICKSERVVWRIAGIVLACCSVGIYQAFIPLILCVLLLYFTDKLVKSDDSSKKLLKKALIILVCAILFALMYFVLNKFFLAVTGEALTDYQGIDQMGRASLDEYILRLKIAYHEFFAPAKNLTYNMYPDSMLTVYRLTLVLSAILSVVLAVKLARKKEILRAVLFCVCVFVVLPLCTCFIFVMTDSNNVHSLMVYSKAVPFVYLAWLADNTEIAVTKCGLRRAVSTVLCALLLLTGVIYVRYDNKCYLKAELIQEEAKSYFTTLVTRICSIDGYSVDLPVVYINDTDKSVKNTTQLVEMNDVKILPYGNIDGYINNYAWVRFMEVWCGFSPTKLEDDEKEAFEALPEVQEMPSYPDDGSIKIINDTIVVKF